MRAWIVGVVNCALAYFVVCIVNGERRRASVVRPARAIDQAMRCIRAFRALGREGTETLRTGSVASSYSTFNNWCFHLPKS